MATVLLPCHRGAASGSVEVPGGARSNPPGPRSASADRTCRVQLSKLGGPPVGAPRPPERAGSRALLGAAPAVCSAGRFQMAPAQGRPRWHLCGPQCPLPSKPGTGLQSSGDFPFPSLSYLPVCKPDICLSHFLSYRVWNSFSLEGGGWGGEESFVIFNSCYKISTLWALKILFS